METTKIIINNEATCEATGELNSGNCKPVFNDEGKKFTSVTDAAKYAGVTTSTMSSCLNGRHRTCNGHAYFFMSHRDEVFDLITRRLAEVTAENEQRKADEEDARKWREQEAEKERKRKEDEARLEAERKAAEKFEQDRQKIIDKIKRRHNVCGRIAVSMTAATERLIAAKNEYFELTGKHYDDSVVA